MKEVEILVKIKEDFETAQKLLSKFKFLGTKNVLDIYFYNEENNNLKLQKDFGLKECFRLRKKGDKNYIAYKIDHFDNSKWIYSDEHETEISDYNSAMEIIKHLGLKELVKVESEKYLYGTYFYEVVLEKVKDLGLFLEVEALNIQEENIEEEKNSIRNFIKALGFDFEELNMGKPEIMLRYENKSKNN